MKKLALSLAALAATASALPAAAGSLADPVVEPVIAPAPAPAPMGGDWTGAYGGVSLGYGTGSVGATDANGMLYGLRGGYDYDFGQFVLGAGIDYDFANIDLDGGAGSIDAVSRLRLKAGADLGNTLVYATGGIARADATVGGADLSDDGWFGGIGADYKLRDNMTIGGEILTHKFSDFDGTGLDVDQTTASVNVGFRF